MSGRIPTLALILGLCGGLVTGCVAGPVFVAPPPATAVPAQPPATAAATPAALAQPTIAATTQPAATAVKPPATVAATQPLTKTTAAANTQVISVPDQGFAFSVPEDWTQQDPGGAGSDVIVVADWVSPDAWNSPPPEGTVAHVVAAATQAFSAGTSETEMAEAAQPDALANQVQSMIQDSCGSNGVIDDPLPIQIGGRAGAWVHCEVTVDGRVMHLSTAYTVRGQVRLAVMGLAIDPAPWSELAPMYETIVKSVQFTK